MLPGFAEQNWVVDACQTFEERHRPAVTIPDGSLPTRYAAWSSSRTSSGVSRPPCPAVRLPTRRRSSRPSGTGSTGCAPRGALRSSPHSNCTAYRAVTLLDDDPGRVAEREAVLGEFLAEDRPGPPGP